MEYRTFNELRSKCDKNKAALRPGMALSVSLKVNNDLHFHIPSVIMFYFILCLFCCCVFYLSNKSVCGFCALDFDECSVYGTCSQSCTNTEGSYTCSCVEGYLPQPDNRSCKAKNGKSNEAAAGISAPVACLLTPVSLFQSP